MNRTLLAAVCATMLAQGCAGQDETWVDEPPQDGIDFSYIDQPPEADPNIFAFDGPEFGDKHLDALAMAGELSGQTGKDLGSLGQPISIPVLYGWGVSSHPATTPAGPNQCVPDNMTRASFYEGGVDGRCGGKRHDPLNFCSDLNACIFPAARRNGIVNGSFVNLYTWGFNINDCLGLSQASKTAIKDGIIDAMAALSSTSGPSRTGWVFQEVPLSQADLKISCDVNIGQKTLASTSMMGDLTRLGGIGNGGLSILDGCAANPTVIEQLFTLDEMYSYSKGEIRINPVSTMAFNTQCTTPSLKGFSNSDAHLRKLMGMTILHETLHWLGFTHQYFSDNTGDLEGWVNPLWPTAQCSEVLPQAVLALPADMILALRAADTLSSPNNLQVGADTSNLACLKPYYDNINPTQDDSFDANPGVAVKYSSWQTYGARTGTSHRECDWFASGQVCAMPTKQNIHWCYGAFAPTQFKRDFDDFTGIEGSISPARVGSAHAGTKVKYGNFSFTWHPSCNDPEVTLVIDAGACNNPTQGSRIDEYVCINYAAPVASGNKLTPVPTSWGIPAGNFFGYDLDGYAVLSIDINAINARTSSGSTVPIPAGYLDWKTELFRQASTLGLSWAIGVGETNGDYGPTHSINSYKFVAPFGKNLYVRTFAPGAPDRIQQDPQIPTGYRSYLAPYQTCKADSFQPYNSGDLKMPSSCGWDGGSNGGVYY